MRNIRIHAVASCYRRGSVLMPDADARDKLSTVAGRGASRAVVLSLLAETHVGERDSACRSPLRGQVRQLPQSTREQAVTRPRVSPTGARSVGGSVHRRSKQDTIVSTFNFQLTTGTSQL
jgi:hypothetical protein